jgi:fructose-1,6-bisphosphatase I
MFKALVYSAAGQGLRAFHVPGYAPQVDGVVMASDAYGPQMIAQPGQYTFPDGSTFKTESESTGMFTTFGLGASAMLGFAAASYALPLYQRRALAAVSAEEPSVESAMVADLAGPIAALSVQGQRVAPLAPLKKRRVTVRSGAPAIAMTVATNSASQSKKMDLIEPVFKEQCEYSGVTLSRYVLEMTRANPDKPDLVELLSVLTAVERACKTISNLVRRAPIESAGLLGLEEGGGSINVQGEEQKKLDVITNTVLKNALRFSGKMAVLASEEEDNPVGVENEDIYARDKEIIVEEGQKYVAVFDPLDGSSNVDANIPTGTIFGIYEEPEGCSINFDEKSGTVADEECLEATLQSGNRLVCAGYCLYSAATSFVLSFGGKTTQGFTYDDSVGEFVLTQPNMQIPARGKPIYSINEANRWQWDEGLRNYITAIQKGEGQTGKQYTARYLGSMVGDIHRTLLYGGIFGYPGDTKNVNGKLRLLYEAAPIAFLMEAAGGKAVTATGERILDIVPTNVHQRVPCFFGSADDVSELESYN